MNTEDAVREPTAYEIAILKGLNRKRENHAPSSKNVSVSTRELSRRARFGRVPVPNLVYAGFKADHVLGRRPAFGPVAELPARVVEDPRVGQTARRRAKNRVARKSRRVNRLRGA